MLPLLLSNICEYFNHKCNFDELFHDWLAGCDLHAHVLGWCHSMDHVGAGASRCDPRHR